MSNEGVTTIVVLGASGDLAKKKIYPVLWSLYRKKLVASTTRIIGYARSKLTQQDLVSRIRPFLASKVQKADEALFEEFLSQCQYFAGGYDSAESFAGLNTYITGQEAAVGVTGSSNRVFYLALPASVFQPVSTCIKENTWSQNGWNRIVVEKPFGRDAASSDKLSVHLTALFHESEIYRIDHYLGKEMVQDLFQLRFGNQMFSSIWNRDNIDNVQVTFKEDFGTQGRGGYFDSSGIIRDILQNHLLQVLSVVAMDAPASLSADDIRTEKVKVLKAIAPIKVEDCNDDAAMGYLDDEGVPDDSVTPTFCTTVLRINNPRWDGVPFIMRAGKALDERKAEIRIQFKDVAGSLFPDGTAARNELVVRIQPDEAVWLKTVGKKPGMSTELVTTYLDLTYKNRYDDYVTVDAYERLILDVINGEQQHFVRSDELSEAWRIWTPVLHQMEAERTKPIPYAYGSRGPPESDEMITRLGYVKNESSNPYVNKPTREERRWSSSPTPSSASKGQEEAATEVSPEKEEWREQEKRDQKGGLVAVAVSVVVWMLLRRFK
eukprot:gene16638-4456_t